MPQGKGLGFFFLWWNPEKQCDKTFITDLCSGQRKWPFRSPRLKEKLENTFKSELQWCLACILSVCSCLSLDFFETYFEIIIYCWFYYSSTHKRQLFEIDINIIVLRKIIIPKLFRCFINVRWGYLKIYQIWPMSEQTVLLPLHFLLDGYFNKMTISQTFNLIVKCFSWLLKYFPKVVLIMLPWMSYDFTL